MTEPNPQRPADGPVMGDHPELETDEEQRLAPAERDARFPPSLVIGAVIALILIAAVIILVLL